MPPGAVLSLALDLAFVGALEEEAREALDMRTEVMSRTGALRFVPRVSATTVAVNGGGERDELAWAYDASFPSSSSSEEMMMRVFLPMVVGIGPQSHNTGANRAWFGSE